MGRRVAITGVAGRIAAAVCAELERRSDVDRIVGIDCRDVPVRTPKLEFHAVDVRDAELAGIVRGSDVLVHLAFSAETMRDMRLMHDVNVGGFANVLDAVASVPVGRLVVVSSSFAYGAHPDNPCPLDESAPLRPSHGYAYAEHKAECEALLRDSEAARSCEVTLLRPAPVLSSIPEGFLARRLSSRVFVSARGHRPPLQLLHEDDLVRGLVHFGLDAEPGTFNLAAPPVDRDGLLTLLGVREVRLPVDLLVGWNDFAWKTGLAACEPGEWDVLVDPLVLSTSAAEAAGWESRADTAKCVRESIAPPSRTRRSRRMSEVRADPA